MIRTCAGILFFSYITLNSMQYEARLQELDRQIAGIGKEIAIINESTYEAVTALCCGSIGSIIHATGHSPCLPFSLGSILCITALVRSLHPSYTNFHAITIGELKAEHCRLLAEKDALIAFAAYDQQERPPSQHFTVTTCSTPTLHKHTARHEET